MKKEYADVKIDSYLDGKLLHSKIEKNRRIYTDKNGEKLINWLYGKEKIYPNPNGGGYVYEYHNESIEQWNDPNGHDFISELLLSNGVKL